MTVHNTHTSQEPQPTLQALASLLSQETETYEHVKALMEQKSQLLAEGKYLQLGNIDQQLVAYGQKGIQLEHERMSVMHQFGNDDLTLQQLIYQLPETVERERLQRARNQMFQVVESIRFLNQDHRKTLNQSIKWVKDTLRVVDEAIMPEPASYHAQNGVSQKAHATRPTQSTVIRDA